MFTIIDGKVTFEHIENVIASECDCNIPVSVYLINKTKMYEYHHKSKHHDHGVISCPSCNYTDYDYVFKSECECISVINYSNLEILECCTYSIQSDNNWLLYGMHQPKIYMSGVYGNINKGDRFQIQDIKVTGGFV